MKRRFYSGVVKYRRAIMVLFAIMTAASAFMYPKVIVNYDLADYLPRDYISTKSLRIMREEFGDMPNARVVLHDVSRQEVREYKARLEKIDGVLDVTWLDSVVPLDAPEAILPEAVTEIFYKDGNAMLTLTVDEDRQYRAIPEIYEVIGEDNCLSGNAVVTVTAFENTIKEGRAVTIAALILLIIVLTVTTSSWTEPLIVILGLAIAVIINAGTNLAFIQLKRYKQDNHTRSVSYVYAKDYPIGFMYAGLKPDKTSGYFSLGLEKGMFDLASGSVDPITTENTVPDKPMYQAMASLGWTLRIYTTNENDIVPKVWLLMTPFSYAGGGFYTKIANPNYNPNTTEEKEFIEKYHWMNALAPEIGLAVRSWRVVLSYRYQYRYVLNKERPASNNLGQTRHLIGLGFCW